MLTFYTRPLDPENVFDNEESARLMVEATARLGDLALTETHAPTKIILTALADALMGCGLHERVAHVYLGCDMDDNGHDIPVVFFAGDGSPDRIYLNDLIMEN